MNEATQEKRIPKSGAFLIEEVGPEDVFVPEHLDPDEKLLGETAERFVEEKVTPRYQEIDDKGAELVSVLVKEVGELGIFTIDIPEALDGLGASKKVSMRVAEAIGSGGSFGVACIVQSGIGGMPIAYFGTEEQRARYLPGILNADTITAYALTEPESGSDALSAKSTAVWDEASNVYVLNGTKQFISNAGFADIFITFAKVDGERFTCFIVEREMEGVSTGLEEKKLGMNGSSTRSLILEDVKVPKENILGKIGKGHRIAFNVLNIGRLKLAPAAYGGAKRALAEGAKYANERKQFGSELAKFGLIRQKLSGAAMRIYCAESMCYRVAALLDEISESEAEKAASSTGEEGATLDPAAPTVAALKALAVECSINKVYASEVLDYVTDEMLQIHGGYGYIKEYRIEGYYRDSRINRIWEGTSEINRMLITGTLVKLGMSGRLDLLPAVKRVVDELMERRRGEPPEGLLGVELQSVSNAKKMTLFCAGAAAQKYLLGLEKQQEILSWVADMVIQVFAMESACLRTVKLAGEIEEERTEARVAASRLAVEHGMTIVESHAKLVLAATHEGEELRSSLSMLKKLMRREPINIVAASRLLGTRVAAAGGYPFR